jgi:cytochrome c oxidase cbb3-type subunit 3
MTRGRSLRSVFGVVVGAALVIVLAAGAAWFWRARMDDRLVRSDADVISGQPDLVRYATAQGKPLYRRYCSGCHGADLRGDPSRGAPNLVDREWLYGSGGVAEIEQTITYGIRSGSPKSRSLAVMPAFGHPAANGREQVSALSPDEIGDLVEFLLSIEGRPSDSAAAARGAQLYSDKGICYDCHSRDAKGDQAIGAPSLTDRTWLYGDGSKSAVFRSIADGREGVCPAFGHRLGSARVRALAVFVHARAQGDGST